MNKDSNLSLPELERLFDNISLECVLDVVEALKNNCRDSYDKDIRYPAFCGILKETEGILLRTYDQKS
ncbi:hypothetical protein ACFLSQ_07865 [Bacteroidota bacterium]